MNKVADFYAGYEEQGRLHRSRSRTLEYFTTMQFVDEYARQERTAIDLGSGPGAYTLSIAPRMKHVLAVDITRKHIQELEASAQVAGIHNISTSCISALEVEPNAVGEFDLVLCLGPYYHLRNQDERILCFEKCRDLSKPDGVIFVSYINRAAAISLYFKNGVFLNAEHYQKIQSKNYEEDLGVDRFLDVSFYSDPELIREEAANAGLEIVEHVGIDGPWNILADKLEEMSESQWGAFQEYHLARCRDPHTLGMSNHGLIICRRMK